jgi:hypothetical protein
MDGRCGSFADTTSPTTWSRSDYCRNEDLKVGARETVDALLERSRRDHVPIRRAFVQSSSRGGGPGPLAQFVRERRARTLDLYLLLHAVASAPPYDVTLPSSVWARALDLAGYASAGSVVSKHWTWLESHGLIESRRRGRYREITLLREDGSAKPYVHPGREGNYFKLPHAYWEANYLNRMGLPAKAVLLIALSLQDDFLLPTEQGAKWYGISRDTVRKGLRILRLLNLLDVQEVPKPAPLAPKGFTLERRYTLREPFRPMEPGERPAEAGSTE